MSSACPQAAKSLFSDSKRRLADRVAVNVNNFASVSRQIARGKIIIFLENKSDLILIFTGSKSNEILMNIAKELAQQEKSLENTTNNLNKIQLIQKQLNYQYEAIKEGSEILGDFKEKVNSMER